MNPDSITGKRHPKLKARLKELARDQILAAAEQAFALEGLHGARMETIARQVGVAVGTLYNHFQDRTALLTALMDARRTEIVARFDAALDRLEGRPFEEQLTAFFTAAFDHFEAHAPFMKVLIESEMMPGNTQRKMMDEVRKRTTMLVQRGVKAKALRADDAEFFGPMLLGIMKVGMLRRLRGELPAGSRMHDQIPTLNKFFLDGAANK